jgi:hypothetical protein
MAISRQPPIESAEATALGPVISALAPLHKMANYKLPVRVQAYNTPSTPVTTYWVPSSW